VLQLRRVKSIYISSLLGLLSPLLHGQLLFTSVDSIFAYADRHSSSTSINSQQLLLARWTKVAALANTVNFRSPVSFAATDNLLLPVNFIPADVFGGPPGTFKQITLGQQYVSNFNFNPQIDIINPGNWARVKSASINQELTETLVQLNKKNLYESLSAVYFNILSLQEQIIILQQNLVAADSLVIIAENKFAEGLVRQQDVNNAKVNRLLVKDKWIQAQAILKQQENSLQILCDIPVNTKIAVSHDAGYEKENYALDLKANSSLLLKSSVLQAAFAKNELRVGRWSTLPVLSAVYFQGWQQNSNTALFDSKQAWIRSQYIGLRITVPFPPDANRLSQNYSYKINSRIAQANAGHARLQNDLNNQNLELEYEKALSTYLGSKEIYELKNSNYQKSFDQYKEGVLSTDILLNAFTDMLNSRVNYVSSRFAFEHAKTKITINNLLK